MRHKYASFNELTFSDFEAPTSYKWNQLMAMLEYARLANGPYSIRVYEQDTTELKVQMLEDTSDIGGLKSLGGNQYQTRWTFRVFYETRETTTGDYACWDVYFTDTGDGLLLATLASGSNIYSNQVNVSDVDNSALYCIRSSGYTTG